MKLKILLSFLVLSSLTFAQQTNGSTFFGQCMIDLQSQEEARDLETQMRENPYIKVVRLDYSTQRAFILTNPLSELSETDFISWFADHSDELRCVQVGRHGVDMVNPYPFEGCEQ